MEIKTFSPKSHKIKALIYGASGTGKTSFGGTAENVLFASAENGLLSIADKNIPYAQITSKEELIELKDFLKSGNHNFETLVIDSITEISDIIKSNIEKRTGKAMQIQDWGELGREVEEIIKDIKMIDINVIVIAQEQTEKDSDKIAKIVPSLYGKSATKIAYYMDIVGYIYVDKEGGRHIITAPNERLLTKDRTGRIGNQTKVDFEEWKRLVSSISTGEEKVLYKTMTLAETKALKQKEKFEEFSEKMKNAKDLTELQSLFGEATRSKIEFGPHYIELSKVKDEVKQKLSETPKENEEKKDDGKVENLSPKTKK